MPLIFKDGKLLFVGDELAMDATCCCTGGEEGCTSDWSFTDKGFIAGGQDGAARAYSSPGSVANSPWSFVTSGSLTGLRIDFEDSDDVPPAYDGEKPPTTGDNCANYNPYVQRATATGTLTLPADGWISFSWEGLGEVQDADFEAMQIYLDGVLVAYALSLIHI